MFLTLTFFQKCVSNRINHDTMWYSLVLSGYGTALTSTHLNTLTTQVTGKSIPSWQHKSQTIPFTNVGERYFFRTRAVFFGCSRSPRGPGAHWANVEKDSGYALRNNPNDLPAMYHCIPFTNIGETRLFTISTRRTRPQAALRHGGGVDDNPTGQLGNK